MSLIIRTDLWVAFNRRDAHECRLIDIDACALSWRVGTTR